MFKQKIADWLMLSISNIAKGISQKFVNQIIINNSKNRLHGDYACSIAMTLASKWKMSPMQIAELILQEQLPSFISKAWVAKPGFINIEICPEAIKTNLNLDILKVNVASKKIVIDYSSPNLAKALHVGHLRTSIIGDALVRINSYIGHEVIRQNHVGDWGTQFGMMLAYIKQNQINISELDQDISTLESIYQSAKKSFDESDIFAKNSRENVVKLQSHEPYAIKVWRQLRKVSLQHCQDIYDRLNLLLTDKDAVGESFYQSQLTEIISQLKINGLVVESDGAYCYFSESETPVILQKQDGGYLYATTDLAAVKHRICALKADKIIYVVDQRQSLHFQMLFELVAKCPWYNNCQLEHVSFGTVNDKSGKPFKTRAGGTIKLNSLLDEAEDRARALILMKQADLPESELAELANSIAISAIKYNDLSKLRVSDYKFNYDNMLKFEGNTAPYILYAYVRLTKLAVWHENIEWTFTETIELDLAKHIISFNEVVLQSANDSMPHYICNFLYELAVLAMKFYEQCPINTAGPIKKERQYMAYIVTKTLKQGLELLGIQVINKM